MIFRVIPRQELSALFGLLADDYEVFGPALRAKGPDKTMLYDFAPLKAFSDFASDCTTTLSSPKKYFLPFEETIASFTFTGGDWEKQVELNIEKPRAIFGLHPCDINALNKLDKVLMEGSYPMPHYAAKRANTFIAGFDCMPLNGCFCHSMGADTALSGFDLFLTPLSGGDIFVEILTDTAYNYIKALTRRFPTEEDHHDYMHVAQQRNGQFTTAVDTTDLTKILDLEFQSDVWLPWGEKCLSCGSCASVCPTCYCYSVLERVDLNLGGARKVKNLHSCNLIDFASVAGGHNFRPESHTRLKYRYYHKHRGFVEAYEESLCVGCGRCGMACPASITVPDVIASVRDETHSIVKKASRRLSL